MARTRKRTDGESKNTIVFPSSSKSCQVLLSYISPPMTPFTSPLLLPIFAQKLQLFCSAAAYVSRKKKKSCAMVRRRIEIRSRAPPFRLRPCASRAKRSLPVPKADQSTCLRLSRRPSVCVHSSSCCVCAACANATESPPRPPFILH